MTLISAISFTVPLVLIALVTLPALYFLLRVTPPAPQHIPFPPLVLIRRTVRDESAPARIPLWILILRLLIATAIILAMSGPIYEPNKSTINAQGPLALYVENGWPAAPVWEKQTKILESLIAEATRNDRNILFISSGDNSSSGGLSAPTAALEKLRALSPVSYRSDRKAAFDRFSDLLRAHPDAEAVLAFDGLATSDDPVIFRTFADEFSGRNIRIIEAGTKGLIALTGAINTAAGLDVTLLRTQQSTATTGKIIALDFKGRNLGEAPFQFSETAIETRTTINLPTDLRNEIARIDIAGIPTSGAVRLIDDSQKRRRVGIVSGNSNDIAEPLLTPNYYLMRALEPHADIREPRKGIADSIATLIEEKVAMIILADVGTLPVDIEGQLKIYLDQGGAVVRFAGSRLANAGPTLLPVRLRGNGRSLQSTLAWEKPQKLKVFEQSSPFFGLPIPDDVMVSRQLLAEPDPDLSKKIWASLTDGTPIVTAERRGKGVLILFHVTADASWSSLPLSGLYLSMFERLLSFTTQERTNISQSDIAAPLQPYRLLDGFGRFINPPVTAKPIRAADSRLADVDHPAGYYGDAIAPFAINSLDEKSDVRAINLTALPGEPIKLKEPDRIDFAPILLIFATILMTIDGFTSLLRGRGRQILSRLRNAALPILVLYSIFAHDVPAFAASPNMSTKDIEGALKTRLAYVLTGDNTVDEISRAGLEALSRTLSERTSFDPAEPIGVDLLRDDLAVYPLIYWPISMQQPVPSLDAVRRIDRFMKNGGTILFDTRDAALTRDGDTTPETAKLRLILAGLSIPPLEPLPQNHVLTKAFYLIDRIVGRTANGQTWLETLPKSDDRDIPAQAGDGVTPIIITSNDLAAAWSTDQQGSALLPIDTSIPRQREMALRGGVNIVMYVLTGNYKADQVHIPALLERLGQ